GPQTAGELRIGTERLHRFSDISAVEGFLHELAARPEGALVAQLPRLPGARETRWAHLLSGAPTLEEPGPAAGAKPDLAARVARLEEDVAMLKEQLARLQK
ncbi:MAG TPA: DUF480 domain-containing protein, partial [Burkholderiales bacterium]